MDPSLSRLDAVELARLIRAGELHPTELLEDTIERIETIDPHVNAVIHRDFEAARRAAADPGLPDGPFRGVPWLLKDLWPGSAGDPHHFGMAGLKQVGWVAAGDANIVRRYREAGFVIVGRTNTPELGLSATTEPLAYGPTRNPWDLDRGSGGSSGGAAAAVAAGMVPAANASDGGGSIRIPAAMCGLVGLKPSRGRVSMGPLQDEWGNSVQHAVCHTVRDAAAILDASAGAFPGDGVIAPPPPRPFAAEVGIDPGELRIGLRTSTPRMEVDAACRDVTIATAQRLEALGHRVVPEYPSALDDQLHVELRVLAQVAVAAQLDQFGGWIGRPITSDDVEPGTWVMARAGRQVDGTSVIAAQNRTHRFRRDVAAWWADGFDLLLTPTTAAPPPRIGALTPTPEDPMRGAVGSSPYAVFTSPFNVTGQPAISIPMGFTPDGLPIGVQLVAAYGREDLLVQVAAQLEAEVAWSRRRSPLHPGRDTVGHRADGRTRE